jgi:hypothetical protein
MLRDVDTFVYVHVGWKKARRSLSVFNKHFLLFLFEQKMIF